MSSIIQNKFHEILGDGARKSKFNFILPPTPAFPLSQQQRNNEILTFLCKGATLPSFKNNPFTFSHKGREIHVRGVNKYSDTFSVTFYLLENHLNKLFFEHWMAMLEQRHFYYDPRRYAYEHLTQMKKTDVTFGIKSGGYSESEDDTTQAKDFPDFMTFYDITAFIEQRNYDGNNVTALYEIKNVFPISVSNVSYDASDSNNVIDFTVDFSYSYYLLYSKPQYQGRLQTQLYATTDGKTHNRHKWDENYFVKDGDFPTEALSKLVYWRPEEKSRWNNNWWRFLEYNQGGNMNEVAVTEKYNVDEFNARNTKYTFKDDIKVEDGSVLNPDTSSKADDVNKTAITQASTSDTSSTSTSNNELFDTLAKLLGLNN